MADGSSTLPTSTIRTELKTQTKLTCYRCGAQFARALSEVTYQNKKWVKAGKRLPKPFLCSRLCGRAHSGEFYSAHLTTVANVAVTLRSREAAKYAKLERKLKAEGIRHKFEYPLTPFIFDLALKFNGKKVLIEFDGRYHDSGPQENRDKQKNKVAKANGWLLLRIPHKAGKPVPVASTLQKLESL